MKPAVKTSLRIAGLLFYLWTCAFLFPMLHDLFHELGHASCGSDMRISLGEYESCSGTICIFPGWFYKSLYRQSMSWGSSEKCSPQVLYAMGGVLGLIMGWVLLTVVVTIAWLIMFYKQPGYVKQALLTGTTFLFVPHYRYSQLQEAKQLPFYMILTLGFGILAVQWDMINDFFYSFFPSRLIIWDFLTFGDGTRVWVLGGYSWDTILTMSYVVFAMLLLFYLITFGVFIRFGVREWRKCRNRNQKINPLMGSGTNPF